MRNRTKYIPKIEMGIGKIFKPIKYPVIPLSINDIYVITTIGDRLDLLANQFYKDVRLWWIIPSANMNIIRRDNMGLKPGIEIRIPMNISQILKNFELINTR